MRVLQLLQKPERRGAEVFANQLREELERRGCTTRCAYLYPYDGASPLSLGNDDVILGGTERHPLDRAIGFDPVLVRRLRAEIARFDPDVVQANGGRTLKYGAIARRRRRDRWALVYRNIGDPSEWVSEGRQRWFYSRVVMPRLDGIVGVSETTLSRLRDLYELDVATARISTAVDLHSFRPTRSRAQVRAAIGTPDDAPVVVFAGSLTREKRPDLAAAVFGRLASAVPATRMWIVGDGPLRSELEANLRSNGYADRAHVLGARSDIANLMAAADILLLPSDTEGVPAVVLEAAAVETPAVATRVGGIPECVIDRETGLLVDAGDVEGLTRAASLLLQDANLRADMGRRARALVCESFALGEIGGEYLGFYEQVFRDRRR